MAKKKLSIIVSVIVLILAFSFSLACEKQVEQTTVEEKTKEEIKTEEIIEVSLKIAVWNDTEDNEPNLEIWIKGTGSWYPDKKSMESGGDFFIPVEPFSTGGINEIYIYPDGRTGSEIMVEIIVTDEMISKSDRDTIIIEISDKTVTVTGTSIKGTTKEFDR